MYMLRPKPKSTALLARAFGAMIFILSSSNAVVAAEVRTYRIEYRNSTPQLLTEPVCAVHDRRASVFKVGESASLGLKELAEDGDSNKFIAELRAKRGVGRVVQGKIVQAGQSSSVLIQTEGKSRLTCVFGMLVSTNDGFPALRSLTLPEKIGVRQRFTAFAYDSGTEQNTESCEHVPGTPCDAHFVGIAENGTIQRHGGILGISDLNSAASGWVEPAVGGVVTRIR